MPSVAGRTLPLLVAIAAVGGGAWLARDAGGAADRTLGRWWIASGIVLGLLLAARAVAAPAARETGPLVGRIGLGAAAAVGLLALGALALSTKRHEIAGVGPVWSLDDDMMITLRYSANLAEGRGLVWNPGERVEGITNLLWALVLALPHLVLGRGQAALAAIALDGLLLLAALGLTFRLAQRLGGSVVAAALAALALATHQATIHWAAAGSEALLLAVLLLVVADAVVRERPGGRSLTTACLAGGLAWLTRPDAAPALAALLAAPLAAGLARAETRKAAASRIALLAALPLAALLFRLGYYGAPLPNTYYLKMTGWDGRAAVGWEYAAGWLRAHPVHVGLALLAPLAAGARWRPAAIVAAALAAHLLYVVQAGGDELMMERFFVPVAPLLFAASLAGADAIARRIGRAVASATAAAVRPAPLLLPAAAFALGTPAGGFLPGAVDPRETNRALAERACVMLGLMIQANTRPDAKVAHFWAGAAAYFSQRRGIDLLGKCDPVIARMAARPGLRTPGHNKYDFGHSLGLEPDVIVGGRGGLLGWEAREAWARASPYRAFADLYDAEGFLSEYVGAAPRDVGRLEAMPQLVGGRDTLLPLEYADASRQFHAVFVRRGTPRARPPAEWVAPTPETLR